MGTFTVPPGDPEALRTLARRLGNHSAAVADDRTSVVRSVAGTIEPALPIARVHDFTTARAQLVDVTRSVGLGLTGVAAAVTTYADALEHARTEIGSARRLHDAAEDDAVRATTAGDLDTASLSKRQMGYEVVRAQTAQSSLRSTTQQVSARLADHVDAWVPSGSSLSGVQAWSAAARRMSPPSVSLDTRGLMDLYRELDPDAILGAQAAKRLITAGTKAYQASQVLKYLVTPASVARAEQNYLEAASIYQAFKGAAPDLSNPGVYADYLLAERRALGAFRTTSAVSADVLQAQREYRIVLSTLGRERALASTLGRFPGLSAAEVIGTAGRFEKYLAPVRVISPIVAKFMGPVSIAVGAYDLYDAVTNDAMDTDDRIAQGIGGGASITAGVALTMVALGATAVVGAPVLLGVAAVAGIVAAGAWIYQNHEEIGHVASEVGHAVADGATKIWHGLFG